MFYLAIGAVHYIHATVWYVAYKTIPVFIDVLITLFLVWTADGTMGRMANSLCLEQENH